MVTSVLPFPRGTDETRSSWWFRSRAHRFLKRDCIPLRRCYGRGDRCRRASVEFESGGQGPSQPWWGRFRHRQGRRSRMSSRDETESCGTHGGPEGHPGIPRKRPSLQGVVTITAAGSPRTFLCARLAPTRTAPRPSEQVLLWSLFPRPSQDTGLRTGDLTQAILLDSLPFGCHDRQRTWDSAGRDQRRAFGRGVGRKSQSRNGSVDVEGRAGSRGGKQVVLRGRLGKQRWLDTPRGHLRRAGGTVSGWADGNLRERRLGALLRGRGGPGGSGEGGAFQEGEGAGEQ